jgi:hypothetical protein
MPAAPEIRFAVDQMLIKLGKYLRILGYDAAWDAGQSTGDQIRRANREGRVFCTRNTHFADGGPMPERVLILASDDPVEQLRRVVAAYSLDTATWLFARCIRCNVPLQEVPAAGEIRALVHPNVFARYDRFYRCPHCDTVFWKGSHVRNTCRKLGLPEP